MCDPISLFEKKCWGKASVTPSGAHEGETDRRLPWTWTSCKALTQASCCPPLRTKTAGRPPKQLRQHSSAFTKSGGKRFGPTGCDLDTRDTKHLLFSSSPPSPGSKPAADWSVWRRRGWREASWCVLSRIRCRGRRGSPRRRPPPGPPPASCTPEPAPERGGRAQLPQGDRQKETFVTPSAPPTGLRSNPVWPLFFVYGQRKHSVGQTSGGSVRTEVFFSLRKRKKSKHAEKMLVCTVCAKIRI